MCILILFFLSSYRAGACGSILPGKLTLRAGASTEFDFLQCHVDRESTVTVGHQATVTYPANSAGVNGFVQELNQLGTKCLDKHLALQNNITIIIVITIASYSHILFSLVIIYLSLLMMPLDFPSHPVPPTSLVMSSSLLMPLARSPPSPGTYLTLDATLQEPSLSPYLTLNAIGKLQFAKPSLPPLVPTSL